MPWLSSVVGVEDSDGARVDTPGTPSLLRLGTGFTATAVVTSTGLVRIEIEIDPDIVPGGVSEAETPLEYEDGVLSILPAANDTRGTMSAADWIKLDASTSTPAAQTLVQWGDDSELQAAWLEAVGDGDVSTAGSVRLGEGGSVYFRNTGSSANVSGLRQGEPNRIHLGAPSQALFAYSSSGLYFGSGADGTWDVHLMAGAAALAVKDVCLMPDGNLSLWISGAAHTVLTDLDTVSGPTGATGPTGPTGPTGATGAAAAAQPITWRYEATSEMLLFELTPSIGFGVTGINIDIAAVGLYADAALTANDADFATINVYKNDGAGGGDTLIASATTTNTGTRPTGNWTAKVLVPLTLIGTPTLLAGETLRGEILKDGTGVVVPPLVLFVAYAPS